MIREIAQKEILENLTTYRFYVLTGLLLVLMLVSIVISLGDYQRRMEDYALLRPGSNSENLIIEPTPLSIFVRGLDGNLGRLYELSSIGIEVHGNQQSVNRLFSLFTVPDMLFVIRVVLALTALLFAYNVITAEKEQGTLKLALANGCGRISLLFGKILGALALVLGPFVILLLASALAVSVLSDVAVNGEFWMRIGLICVGAGLYVFAFTALGVFLSATAARSTISLMLCLACWVLLVFVVPNLGTSVAETVADVPSADRVEMQERLSEIQAIFEAQKDWNAGGSRTVYGTMVQKIWDAHRRVSESYRPKLDRLISVTRTVLRFSPAGALTFLLTDISATGLREDLRLKDAVTGYINRNFDMFMSGRKDAVDAFRYTREPLGEAMRGSGIVDGFMLTLFGSACVLGSIALFARYDPR